MPSPDLPLPPPAVPADLYDEGYYRHCCMGSEQWQASEGQRFAGLYHGFLDRAGLQPGEVVVDMGTGRGELPVVAVELGADRAYGVEYSADAVRLAATTVDQHGAGDRVEIIHGDARAVPLPDGCADLVSYVDVVEHLAPDELHRSLLEARRLLKPGGRVVAHTMPNRLIYDVTYRAMRLAALGRWPAEPRLPIEKQLHVNEHSPRSLRRAFTGAGFEVDVQLGVMVYPDVFPPSWAKRALRGLSRTPLRALAIADLWAIGRRR